MAEGVEEETDTAVLRAFIKRQSVQFNAALVVRYRKQVARFMHWT